MKKGYIKLEFIKDYSCFKKGDTFDFKKSLAHYIIKDGCAKEFKQKTVKKK